MRRKKSDLKKNKDELWKWFSKFVRLRDGGVCITCGRKSFGSGYHAGHFIPAAVGGLSLMYHEDNVHGQCYHCNINLGGWGERYTQKMEELYGKKFVNNLRMLTNKVIHSSEFPFKEKIEYYKKRVKELDTKQ